MDSDCATSLSPDFYESIHPPCEVQFLRRFSLDKVDDNDEEFGDAFSEVNPSDLSSPPDSPLALSPAPVPPPPLVVLPRVSALPLHNSISTSSIDDQHPSEPRLDLPPWKKRSSTLANSESKIAILLPFEDEDMDKIRTSVDGISLSGREGTDKVTNFRFLTEPDDEMDQPFGCSQPAILSHPLSTQALSQRPLYTSMMPSALRQYGNGDETADDSEEFRDINAAPTDEDPSSPWGFKTCHRNEAIKLARHETESRPLLDRSATTNSPESPPQTIQQQICSSLPLTLESINAIPTNALSNTVATSNTISAASNTAATDLEQTAPTHSNRIMLSLLNQCVIEAVSPVIPVSTMVTEKSLKVQEEPSKVGVDMTPTTNGFSNANEALSHATVKSSDSPNHPQDECDEMHSHFDCSASYDSVHSAVNAAFQHRHPNVSHPAKGTGVSPLSAADIQHPDLQATDCADHAEDSLMVNHATALIGKSSINSKLTIVGSGSAMDELSQRDQKLHLQTESFPLMTPTLKLERPIEPQLERNDQAFARAKITACTKAETDVSISLESTRPPSFASPEKLSIIGVSSPPAMKRLNEPFEAVVGLDDAKMSQRTTDQIGDDFALSSNNIREIIRSSEFFHDPDRNGVLAESPDSLKVGLGANFLSQSPKTKMTQHPKDESISIPLLDVDDSLPSQMSSDNQMTGTKSASTKPSISRNVETMPAPTSESIQKSIQRGVLCDKSSIQYASASEGGSICEASMSVQVKPLDNEIGIPKGDVMISLLSKDSLWSRNVSEAVWRCRTMRRNCDMKWLKDKSERKTLINTSRAETSFLSGSSGSRNSTDSLIAMQNSAMELLKFDELDDALVVYEDIVQTFYAQEFDKSDSKLSKYGGGDVSDFKLFAGQATHNLGVINLLIGDYNEAVTYFERATLSRASSCGVGHPDHLSSLIRMATCHFARAKFSLAQSELEEAVACLRDKRSSTTDCRILAEALNNLGCLLYMNGRIEEAVSHFEESLDLQGHIADQSLYAGSRFSYHNGALNSTITKGNIGLIALASGDPSVSVVAFEAALRDQQLLLRDAHVTLLATIEHLSIANQINGSKEKAIQLLKRMLHMQIDVYGSDDARCFATGEKISVLLFDGDEESPSELSTDRKTTTNGKHRTFSILRRRPSKNYTKL